MNFQGGHDPSAGNSAAESTNRVALFIPDYPIWRNRPGRWAIWVDADELSRLRQLQTCPREGESHHFPVALKTPLRPVITMRKDLP